MAIIAIDGPAGAGKTTIGKKLAKKLNIKHVNSGMIYRAMTYHGLITYNQEFSHKILEIASHFSKSPDRLEIEWDKDTQYILMDGKKLSEELFDKGVTNNIFHVSDSPECRKIVNERLSIAAIKYDLVIDGRDIGSKVFPQAEYKFFLDATIEERAKRRSLEKGITLYSDPFKKLVGEIRKRDEDDKNREIAPLVIPKDAIYINTTGKSIDEIIDFMSAKVELTP